MRKRFFGPTLSPLPFALCSVALSPLPFALSLLCALLLALSASVEAQQGGKLARVGFIALGTAPGSFYEVFREGLRELGYVEGKNIIIEYRSGEGSFRLTELVAELVQKRVDVIVTPGGSTLLAKIATETVPIVFSFSGDPVAAGHVQSLARPAGNMTGITWLAFELVGKRLELLKEAVPRVSRVTVLANPAHPGEQRELQATQSTARQLGINLLYHQISATNDLSAVWEAMTGQNPNALLVFPEGVTLGHSQRIAQLAGYATPSKHVRMERVC